MIKKVEINGIHYVVGDDLKKYIVKKLNRIERYVPKLARQSIHVEIKLKEEKSNNKKDCQCRAVVHLPGSDISADATTVNMYAAYDIVVAKLKSQIDRYRQQNNKHGDTKSKAKIRKLIGKIRSH